MIDCDGDKKMDRACLKDGRNLDVILSTKNCSGIICNVSYEMCPDIINGMIFCKHTCLQCLLAKKILQVLFRRPSNAGASKSLILPEDKAFQKLAFWRSLSCRVS